MASDYILSLQHLRELRMSAGLTPKNIVAISESKRSRNPTADIITIERLRTLENLPRHEPTYAEARDLSRILLLPGIVPLITPTNLYAMDAVLGPLQETDFDLWRMSDLVPLSVACRVTVALGLDDPIELEHLSIHEQAWAILEQNERGASPGACPWCLGVRGHHTSKCLPAALWAPRGHKTIMTSDIPAPARPRTRGNSRFAHGLKLCRTARGIKQQQLAADVGVHPNYLSRMEQLDRPLTRELAERIAARLGCTVEALYS